jgi:DNA polymerase-3 subunit delta
VKLYPEKLADHLRGDLAPVYLVSGDEPLQVGECSDAIRQAARDAGFSAREVLEADANFDWQQLAAKASALSLFAERQVIDLRIANGKPGNEGGKAITAYCDNPPPDTLLLLTLPKLDRQQRASKWFKAVDRVGGVLQVWPIDADGMARWIEQRLRAAGLSATREAVQILAERAEGNLLAAAQEIQKLALLRGAGELDETALRAAVADSARYDVFELVDSALRRQPARCLHIIAGLRGEGVAAPVVLWALHRETQMLAQLSADSARGLGIDHAMSRSKIFPKRQALVRRGLGNLTTAQWLGLLRYCEAADRAVKGALRADPWLLLEQIALRMAGQQALGVTLPGDAA